MTYEGSALSRFMRALDRSDVLGADVAARELPSLNLRDALRLVALYAKTENRKFERAALRWLCRLLEEQSLTLDEARVACEWLSALTGADADLALTSLSAYVFRP